jgi:type IV secretory pathway VirB4 component
MNEKKATPSQKFIVADSVKDNVILMKDGSLKAILLASSLNFELKSANEQNALLFQYQNFLNSLDFSIQIVTHSRKLEIEDYLNTITEQSRLETNELLKIQSQEYVEFVREFVNLSNIMSKSFYIVVSISPIENIKQGIFSQLFSPKSQSLIDEKELKRLENQLDQRVDYILSGIHSVGIRAVRLGHDELIELLYSLYNPGEEKREELLQAASS